MTGNRKYLVPIPWVNRQTFNPIHSFIPQPKTTESRSDEMSKREEKEYKYPHRLRRNKKKHGRTLKVPKVCP